MVFDTGFYSNIQAPQIANPMDTMAKAMTMKNLAYQNQVNDRSMAQDQATRDAFRQNVTTDASGNPNLDTSAAIASLYKNPNANPMDTMALQKNLQSQNIAQLQQKRELAKNIVWGMNDPASYKQGLAQLAQVGAPNLEHYPQEYDPKFVQSIKMQSLSPEDQAKFTQEQKGQDIREKEFAIKQQELGQKRDDSQSDKSTKLATAMKNDFDADKGRAGNFGQISAKVQGAERLQTLISAFKDGNLPKAQMEELSLGLSNMLAGSGGAARAQVEALVPHTLFGQTQDAASWLMNEPRGAGQQKFVDMMAGTIDREKQTAQNQLNSIRAQRLPLYDKLKKNDPTMYNNLLQSYGLDTNNIKNGKYVTPSAPAVDADLGKMSNDELKAYIKSHEGQ